MSLQYVPEVFPQNGELGCYTACAAFIGSVLTEKTLRPEEVDDFCKRAPDGPMDAYRTQAWLLGVGLTVEIYESDFYSRAIKPFLQGDITLKEYLDAGFEGEEDDTPETRAMLGEWMEQTYKPSYVATKPLLDIHRELGRYVEHPTPRPSVELANHVLDAGKALLTFLTSARNEGYTHAVALVKSSKSSKPYIYIPDEGEYGGSVFRPLIKKDLDDIDCTEEFTVVGA